MHDRFAHQIPHNWRKLSPVRKYSQFTLPIHHISDTEMIHAGTIFGSRMKYSTVNSWSLSRTRRLLTDRTANERARIHPKFILFSHYSDYANADTREKIELGNLLARKETFPLNYLSSWVPAVDGVWPGEDDDDEKYINSKIFCIMNSKYTHRLYLHISHVCGAVFVLFRVKKYVTCHTGAM